MGRAKVISVVFLLCAGMGAQAQSESHSNSLSSSLSEEWRNSKLSTSLGMSLRNIQDEFTQARLLRVDAGIFGETEFTPWLSGKLGIKFISMGGSTVSVTEEFAPKSAFGFEETLLELRPVDFFSTQVGFVTIQTSESIDIMQTKEHPGILATLSTSSEFPTRVQGQVFSVVPTSTLVTPRYFPADGNPGLSGASIKAGYYPEEGIQLGLQASRLNFQNLTPSIAQDSRLLGNDIVGLGAASSRFAYEFDTEEWNAGVGYRASRWESRLEATRATNHKAPADLGTGLHGGGSLKYRWDRFSVKASYSEFYVGSEVYPGSIAGDLFSYNNRTGRQIGFGVENPKSTLGLRLSYHTYNEILDQAFLSDRSYVGLRFFALKDIFADSGGLQ